MFFYCMKDEYHLELINYCMHLLVGRANDCSGSNIPQNRVFQDWLPHPPLVVWNDLYKDHIGFIIPPANFVCGGVYCFHVVRPSVCPSVPACVRPSVTFCFLNNLKSNCWIFIKLCKNIHICKTNTSNKKVRTRGQFY